MGRNILSFFSLFIFSGMFCLQLQAQAELVNYEETWQKFLKEPLTSAVSKLTKPDKSNSSDYLKYCLMTATSYFCADDLREANELMAEIRKSAQKNTAKFRGIKSAMMI
jgi:hypothetical protein